MRGGQWQVLLLMEALARRGHQQELLAPRGAPLLARAAGGGLAASALRPGWRLPAADLVHAHDAGAHTLAALRRAAPLVVSRRVAFPVRRGPLSRWKYARAARYIAVSQYVARELRSSGIPGERIDVIYDGVRLPPLERAAELRAEYRRRSAIPPEAFVAGTLAALREKPYVPLLEAVLDKPVEMLIATADLPEGRRLDSSAMPNVHFFRPEQDVSPFLFALDAFVYLSESEGLGSAALLAMAHGLPVIASDAGGLPEIVRDGETGLLIDNSTEELRAALERLLARPEQAAALGRQGRALVERCASDDIMAEQTEQTYQKAVQGPTSKVQSRSGPGV